MPVSFDKASLESLPGYPQVAHVPVAQLRLDPADLPDQRLDGAGLPVCWAGNHAVRGGALLCARCKRVSGNLTQKRRRERNSTTMTISKDSLEEIHASVDALSPLMQDLTVAYNNGGNLRDEVNRIMLEIKRMERKIRTLLPDPRSF